MSDTVEITELIEIDPSRVDAVGSPANGTEWLILKAVAEKADGDRPACKTCHGDGKIMDNKRTCPDCKGSGVQPAVGDTEKSLLELAAVKASSGAAASGVATPPADHCPTCNGSGNIADGDMTDDSTTCPDCGGSGKDGQFPPDDKLNMQDAFAGSSNDGDGRTTIDKAEMSGKSQNDLPDSAFAYIEPGGTKDDDGKTVPRSKRHFPVHDAAHARNALARAPQSPFGDKAMPKIKAAANKFGIEVSAKSLEVVEKDGVTSGPNPFLGGAVNSSTTDPNATDGTTDDDDDVNTPGSPDWEGVDADIATAAATALLEAAELIRQFADRESIEVAAGEGNDVFDTWDAQCALDAVTAAVGMMATLAFHEGVAAQKSENVAEKAGRRLSTKSVTALAAARDKAGDLANHITKLLGDDDPAKSDDDATAKSQEDVLNMDKDELSTLVAETVAKAVDSVSKAKMPDQDVDNNDSVAGGKAANAKAKKKMPKAENTDLEDEADQGDNDSASSPAKGAAKAAKKEAREAAEAARTPEEIEAAEAVKAQKKELKKAKKAEKTAAKHAALTKAIEEATAGVRDSNAVLQERLAMVEKMAAPGGPVKTVPQVAKTVAAERDAIDLEITRLENVAKSTQDRDIRSGSLDRLKELKAKRSAL